MPSRREFLARTVALAAVPLVVAPVPASPPPQRRRQRPRGHHAVFCSVLPEAFVPERCDDLPIALAGPAWCIDVGLTLKKATERAHAHNRRALADGLPGREWAFVVSYLLDKTGGAS